MWTTNREDEGPRSQIPMPGRRVRTTAPCLRSPQQCETTPKSTSKRYASGKCGSLSGNRAEEKKLIRDLTFQHQPKASGLFLLRISSNITTTVSKPKNYRYPSSANEVSISTTSQIYAATKETPKVCYVSETDPSFEERRERQPTTPTPTARG